MRPRPFGEQLRSALRMVDAQGPSTHAQVDVDGLARQNVHKVLSRGVGLGLLTTDRSVRPRTFTTVPGWEERLEHHSTTRVRTYKPYGPRKRKPKPSPPVYAFTSVWVQLA